MKRRTYKNKGAPLKAFLDFHDQIRAAFLHYVVGLDQATIMIALGVANQGRINECCVAVRKALLAIPRKEAPDVEQTHSADSNAPPAEETKDLFAGLPGPVVRAVGK
jgi:hypothetical protein